MTAVVEQIGLVRSDTSRIRRRVPDATPELLGATLDLAAVGLAAFLTVLVAFDVDVWLRPPLALVFMLLVPGWVILRRWGATASLLTAIGSVAVSVTIMIVLGQALVMSGGWQWYPAALVLMLSCVAIGSITVHRRSADRARLRDLAARRPATVSPAAIVAWSTVVGGNALVALGIRHSSLADADVLGLLGALSLWYWLGLLVILAGLMRTCSLGSRWAWLSVTALMVALHGLPGMLEANPRFSVAWIHTGFSRHIAEQGTLLTNLDARFSWAGFFSGSALFQRIADTESLLWLVRYAPLFYNGCAIVLVAILARRLRATEVQTVVAATLFCCLNWIAQDYYSPQATAFLLYLAVIVVLLTVFPENPATLPRWAATVLRPAADTAPAMAGRPAVAALGGCYLVVIALVISHQLTPAFLMSATALLVLCRVTRVRAFPLFVAVVFLAWLSYGADAYWYGHLDTLLGSVGEVSNIVNQNVGSRAESAVFERQVVVGSRIGLALVGWVVAALSVLWQWWRRRTPLALVCLLVAPFPMLVLQPYGGEMALRVCLFSLPAVCILVAQLAVPRTFRVSARRLMPLCVLLALLLPVFITARFGNESFEAFSDADVELNRVVYEVVPDDSIIYLDNRQAPIYSERVGEVRYRDLPYGTPTEVADALIDEQPRTPVYVLLTESQAAYEVVTDGRDADWMAILANELMLTGRFEVVAQAGGGVLLRLVGT